jgi:uncharacterized protein (DUF302 family)
MATSQLALEYPSRLDFDNTVASIIAEAEKREWKVPAVHDLQASLAKSGIEVKPIKVIEICKPMYSGQMLKLNHERIISVMMPCRISVYLKDDGHSYISLINTGELASGLEEHIAQVMKDASDETLEIVKTVSA